MWVRRSLVAGVVAVALSGTGLGIAVGEPTPVTQTGSVRWAGPDRYATSVAISRATFEAPVGTVYVASGQGFADALAGGPAAAMMSGPVLLITKDKVPSAVLAEITRLRPDRIRILGGTGAIGAEVQSALEPLTAGGVQRLGGQDRYATAAKVSAATWSGSSTVFIASGLSFPDALSGGAAAAKSSAPVLLSGPSALPAPTATELARLKPTRIVLLGGTGVLTGNVEQQLRQRVPGASVVRYGGADRYATSASVARAFWPQGAPRVMLTSASTYPDALSGVPSSKVNDAPLLLTNPTCQPRPVYDALTALAPTTFVALGGPAVAAGTPSLCTGTALKALSGLPVKGRAPKTGYDRDLFGPPWSDAVNVNGGHNGCDTRNDILRRDLTDQVLKADSNGCTVLSGTLKDPYTTKTIHFVRGPDSGDVQIDHMVALSDAWQKGAQALSSDKRKDLANDPLNLIAVDGPTNRAKGDGDAATWLPPNKAIRCRYVAAQIAVKQRYTLWVTAAEKDAMNTILSTCPAQPLPTTESTAVPAPVR